jgi:peptide-methionine (R)-S-oxide reductase
VQRRQFLLGTTAVGTAAALGSLALRQLAHGGIRYPITHSDRQWQRLLSPARYDVLREGSTEMPFSSPLLHEHRSGVFGCAGCDTALFSSTTKFDSGTGWPSFWAPLPHAVATSRDNSFGLRRTEVHCVGCGSHLGHVFEDGPQPTGLRYCMNGLALVFRPLAGALAG